MSSFDINFPLSEFEIYSNRKRFTLILPYGSPMAAHFQPEAMVRMVGWNDEEYGDILNGDVEIDYSHIVEKSYFDIEYIRHCSLRNVASFEWRQNWGPASPTQFMKWTNDEETQIGLDSSVTIICLQKPVHDLRTLHSNYGKRVKKRDPKSEILEQSKKYNLAASVSQDEFDRALDSLMSVLLFGSKWEDEVIKNPKLRREIPLINNMPMMCKADGCPFAQRCPVLRNIRKEDKVKLIGTECRVDKEEAVQEFTRWIKTLDVSPDSSPDILAIVDLVRLIIYKRRMDWQIGNDDLMVEEVAGLDNKGREIRRRTPHPLLKELERLNKIISKVQGDLMLMRRDRAHLAAQFGKNVQSLEDLFTGAKAVADEGTIEADFTVVEPEDE